MTGPYLESGTLTEFQPLGSGGDTLFGSAPELRAAIARRLGKEAVDCFAIPQQNADGDTLDWYAPNPGTVIRWDGLSDEQQAEALEQVGKLQSRISDLSQSLSRDETSERRVLGMLLAHATIIPDASHVFLVGNRPVLSFWGFRRHDEKETANTMAGRVCIHQPRPPNAGAPPPGPGSPAGGSVRPTGYRIFGIDRRWLVLAILALLVLLLFLLPWGGEQPGTPDFLNGTWRASSASLQDTNTKQPIELAYVLDDGEGEVRVTEQDGSVCRAPVDAVFDQGTLTLTPRTDIVCENQAPFHRTVVTCRPGAGDHAVCDGSFPDGRSFQVDMYKQQ